MKDTEETAEVTLEDHPTIIYVVGSDREGPVKIGITTRLPERIAHLQGGSWSPLYVWAFRGALRLDQATKTSRRLSAYAGGARSVEAAVHLKLSELGLRLMGEWFDISADEALEAINKCSDFKGCRVFSMEDLSAADRAGFLDGRVLNEHKRLLRSFVEVNAFALRHNELAKDLFESRTS